VNSVTLTDKQLDVLKDALEVYDRLNGGQFDIAYDVLCSNPGFGVRPYVDHDAVNHANKTFRAMFPDDDCRRSTSVASWVGNEKAFLARDIYMVIRQELAYRQYPEGGWQTMFHDPLHYDKDPLPTITPSYKDK